MRVLKGDVSPKSDAALGMQRMATISVNLVFDLV